ncbi:uncharacterized protein LOC113353462 [Papaver somniferum]|uniref:uncharacterized protein LOC113353462 n=1 Tax=Papaver somniferum TaxID=3469 RepID=UPI000E7006EA|nr:uncharacterized protein LOC113353462 [Papaver somniferum]
MQIFTAPVGSTFNLGFNENVSSGNSGASVVWSVSCTSVSQTVFTSSGVVFNSATVSNFSSDVYVNRFTDYAMMSNPIIEIFSDRDVLEPTSIATLPPEPIVTDEEFQKEVNLMMMDTVDSMDAEPSLAHDLFRKTGRKS